MAARDKHDVEQRYFKLVDDVAMPCTRAEALALLAKGGRQIRRNKVLGHVITTTFGVVNVAPPGAMPLLFDTLVTNKSGSFIKLWRTPNLAMAKHKHVWAMAKLLAGELDVEPDDMTKEKQKP